MRIITTIILSILLTPFFCHAEERCETKSISASFSLEKWSTSSIPSDTTITDTLRQADIRFDEPRFSFGNISQSKGPKQTHSFWFENTGKAPLFILEAISGCGCTVPKYTKDAVAPGERGKVDVTFDATDRQLGHFVKSVTVYINSVHSYTRLFIEGTIVE